MVKSNLRKTWLHDTLLKVRTSQDVKNEAFDNRTVILHGIPKHLRAEQLLEHFTSSSQHSVVGVELPLENTKLRDLRKKIAERQDQPIEVEKEVNRRRAILAVEESNQAE